jgi:hypothetical protein
MNVVNAEPLSEIHACWQIEYSTEELKPLTHGGKSMEIIFIRHGHGEHLLDHPNQLNTLHPSLTDYGTFQVKQLQENFPIFNDDLMLVSPTKRTIQTAQILAPTNKLYISPLVGPRMFPQNPDLPALKCDYIYSKEEIIELYKI